jgi:hypothetical protein
MGKLQLFTSFRIFNHLSAELCTFNFWNIKMKIYSWSVNSIKLGQMAWAYVLAWLYTGGKGLSLLVSSKVRIKLCSKNVYF